MHFRVLALVAFSAAALAACSGTQRSALPATSALPGSESHVQQMAPAAFRAPLFGYLPAPGRYHAACASLGFEVAHCHAQLRDDVFPNAANPAGYHPADLQAAYRLTADSSSRGSGQTVAIVDAYNDPRAAADLAVYRSTFGLPACATSSGCLRIVNQSGGTQLPASDGGWAQEESLDLDMVSAMCPHCRILLVEATTPSYANLGTAVNSAARLGAREISNSYGGGESASDTAYDAAYYKHAGFAITVSAGDSGYGPEYPAASQYVTAVGGTSLYRSSSARGWSETVWSGTGSGCSAYDPQRSWQAATSTVKDNRGVCGRRIVGDVSSDADPNTGVAVYDSYAYQGQSGWLVFGGTSVAAPTVAAVYALAGNATSLSYGSHPYGHASALFDVTSGSNGSCGGKYLCTAKPAYDGPTGLGTPNGIGAF